VKIDEWGKRRLAYEINDVWDGLYFILYFQAKVATLDEVTRILKISDKVLRFMPVRLEKPLSAPQPVAAPAPAPAPAPTVTPEPVAAAAPAAETPAAEAPAVDAPAAEAPAPEAEEA
jgi:hypothetical protein